MNSYIEGQLKIDLHLVIGRTADSLDFDPCEMLDLAMIDPTQLDSYMISQGLIGHWDTPIRIVYPIMRRMIEDLSPELINALRIQLNEEF
jgi:hypothetical protein